jgi:hypothetical protein
MVIANGAPLVQSRVTQQRCHTRVRGTRERTGDGEHFLQKTRDEADTLVACCEKQNLSSLIYEYLFFHGKQWNASIPKF